MGEGLRNVNVDLGKCTRVLKSYGPGPCNNNADRSPARHTVDTSRYLASNFIDVLSIRPS